MEDRNFLIAFLWAVLRDEKKCGMTIFYSDNHLRCMSLKEVLLFKHLSQL